MSKEITRLKTLSKAIGYPDYVFYRMFLKKIDDKDKRIGADGYYDYNIVDYLRTILEEIYKSGDTDIKDEVSKKFIDKYYNHISNPSESAIDVKIGSDITSGSADNYSRIMKGQDENGKRRNPSPNNRFGKAFIQSSDDMVDRVNIDYFVVPAAYFMQFLYLFKCNRNSECKWDAGDKKMIYGEDFSQAKKKSIITKVLDDNIWDDISEYNEYYSSEEYFNAVVKEIMLQGEIYDDIQEVKDYLSCNNNKVSSFYDLAYIIYYVIMYAIKVDYKGVSENNISLKEVNNDIACNSDDLQKEWDFYNKTIARYGYNNMDRKNILEKYAEYNVYAAIELGDIYYYGMDLFVNGSNNRHHIRQNMEKAAYYYGLGYKKYRLPSSACSFGNMILDEKIIIYDSKKRLEKAEEFFEKCGDYANAYHGLCKVEKERVDQLIGSSAKNDDILNHIKNLVKYGVKAINSGWYYSCNVIAAMLMDKRYKNYWSAITDNLPDEYNSSVKLLSKAAGEGIIWSMNKLAEVIYESGDVIDYGKAKELLEKCSELGYERATYNLSKYVYTKDKDSGKHLKYLTEAADAGYGEALREWKKEYGQDYSGYVKIYKKKK